MHDTLTIALLQHAPVPADTDAAISRLRDAAGRAASQGAQLLVVPEASVTGYNIPPDVMQKVAERADGPVAESIADICRSHNIAIGYGFAEKDSNGYYNCVQLIDRHGERRVSYRKTHLWGELDKSLFSAGHTLTAPVTIEGWNIGILICYDVEFPECARELALRGAELIIVPTGLMQPWREVAEKVVPVRAYENQLYIAYTNYCGSERELHYEGRSVVAGPNGEDLARAGQQPEMLLATLDKNSLQAARQALPYHRDRRPELYRAISADKLTGEQI